MNASILSRGSHLKGVNEWRWLLSKLMFADDCALVADSEEIFCRLVAEIGRV